MVTVVGIRFKKAGKIYYFDPGDFKIAVGDGCVVETARGVEFGEIVIGPKKVKEEEIVPPLKQVLRTATPDDYHRLEENKDRAAEAFRIALRKIDEHELPMKLLHSEYTLDNNKLIFYFSAEGRVDFRELVKDLAAIFRLRIELRQIGVRDEAKMIGGLGSCGRALCCTTFMGDFEPVSIRMAKNQNLSLNPAKISGACGRLMCCLRFEAQMYEDNKQRFGKSASAQGPVVADEFYHELEGETDYYSDLLQEDTIQEVDYQMMLETIKVEESTKVDEDAKAQSSLKKARGKKRRRPRRKRKKNPKSK
ncbi:MAG: stage 0 sporulation family protein [Firmicutes bacterium]|nr:stage 0 sporulation family protein [Bacillota bacterium]